MTDQPPTPRRVKLSRVKGSRMPEGTGQAPGLGQHSPEEQMMTTPTPWLTFLRVSPRWCEHDTQAVHRSVAHATEGARGRLLWCRPRREVLIVQSGVPVPPGAIGGAREMGSAPVRTDHDSGSRVVLSLIANPTVARAVPDRRGVRVPLDSEEWVPWLRRKLGVALAMDEVVDVEPLGTAIGRRHGTVVSHRLAGFTAFGTVTDPAALADLIRGGVGSGKAYGAGLLLVAQVAS